MYCHILRIRAISTSESTDSMIVPTGHTNLKIAAVHLVVQKVVQWKFRRQTQKEVVPVDYLFDRVGRWVIKMGIKQCNQQHVLTIITFFALFTNFSYCPLIHLHEQSSTGQLSVQRSTTFV